MNEHKYKSVVYYTVKLVLHKQRQAKLLAAAPSMQADQLTKLTECDTEIDFLQTPDALKNAPCQPPPKQLHLTRPRKHKHPESVTEASMFSAAFQHS